jgi:RNA polymerase sigma-70 factor (ECF subfamily)
MFSLEQVLRAGAETWPDVRLDSCELQAYLDQHAGEMAAESTLRAADLFLACACISGDAQALRHFESLCRHELRMAIQLLKVSKSEDDLLSILLTKLLVDKPGAEAKLRQYAGHSRLRRWVQVIAVHHVLNATEQPEREKPIPEALLHEMVDKGNVEWRPLDASAREAFKTALVKGLASLESRDRNLLRHRIAGLSLTAIAALYAVNVSTVSRWLTRVEAILEQTVLSELRKALRLRGPDLDSLVRSVLSVVDSSVCGEVARGLRDEAT